MTMLMVLHSLKTTVHYSDSGGLVSSPLNLAINSMGWTKWGFFYQKQSESEFKKTLLIPKEIAQIAL